MITTATVDDKHAGPYIQTPTGAELVAQHEVLV